MIPHKRQPSWLRATIRSALFGAVLFVVGVAQGYTVYAADGALVEEPLPYLTDGDLPERTPPIVEIGPRFLGTGNISEGFELPTGAVWQPALWVFGDYRTALNYVADDDSGDIEEWANSLDLFANLQLSGTERVLLGINPLQENGNSSGYIGKPEGDTNGTQNHLNGRITTLFFEGEFGEIFPRLDPEDRGAYDLGFAIGRQPVFFQEGVMLNDTIDAIGINRDTLQFEGIVDSRLTALFGWGEVNRDDNIEDKEALLYGLFSETDFRTSTVNVDIAYIDSDEASGGQGDGFYAGASATQRIGQINTSFRVNSSHAQETPNNAVSDGVVFMAETSFTPAKTDDVAYFNGFAGIDHYSSASRSPTSGGPLGRIGILFALPGIGEVGAPISNRADEVAGGAVGYQMFFDNARRQVIAEIGGRIAYDAAASDQGGVGARFQQAIGQRHVFQVDVFAVAKQNESDNFGIRTEWIVRF
ncbi:MAG: hypothetical protein HOC63_04970 [Rhodospirillales bacterium]|nr:hypothetical protein [Rhodospirillales bacterium]MBT4039329.1 hypothetical protein [Rhodospirillales bacterium]MBT4626024.1 hypothetical protein [Rhodospirillales bacterium]MBT5351761.1 hypothetical protein [Rhodospirillales bacterium]MBT6111965.1 hypothetical protein [Rhodospirillales bacterium]